MNQNPKIGKALSLPGTTTVVITSLLNTPVTGGAAKKNQFEQRHIRPKNNMQSCKHPNMGIKS